MSEFIAELGERDPARLEDELGDLLFSCVNLSRHVGVDAEHALQQANRKFEHRFRALEGLVQMAEKELQSMSIDELEMVWQQVKKE